MSNAPPPPDSAPVNPPPGWYPDPLGRGDYRWWDGTTWSEHAAGTPGDRPGEMSSVSDWMNKVFRIAADRSGHLFTMIVLLIVPTTLFYALSFFYGFKDAALVIDDPEIRFENAGGSTAIYVTFAIATLLTFVASLYLAAAAARHAFVAAGEEPEPWSASLTGVLRRLARLGGVSLIIGGVLLVAYIVMIFIIAVAPPLAVLALPLWLVSSVWVFVRWGLAPIAATLAPSGSSSVSSSMELTKGRFWAVFGRMALLTLLGFAVIMISGLVAMPFTALAGGSSATGFQAGDESILFGDILGDNPAVFAISQLFNAIGSGAAAALWGVGLALIYRDLRGPSDE